ncbi:MAG: thiamine biosynthesis protein, partial [Deltaproteobacteria bacterium]
MKHNSYSPSAIALISGGLDSALAASLVKQWGIHVIGLHLTSPFGCTTEAQKVAEEIQIPLQIRAKGEAFIDLIEKPKYGYGSQMNPCIDCRIYMFEWAEKVRQELGADFIVTGEVVGQRPLSQNKAAMALIDRNSPLEDRVLRPLSGGNLPPTLPEKRGWIQREQLRKFSGRGRTEQLALAKELGISAYTSPGGGCLLTEKAFSDRLRDFYRHPHFSTSEQKTAQAELLRLGRHFRPSSDFK